jgi:hypothetical protein
MKEKVVTMLTSIIAYSLALEIERKILRGGVTVGLQ